MTSVSRTIATTDAAAGTWEEGADERTPDLLASIAAIERTHSAPRQRAGAFVDVAVESLKGLAGCITVGVGGDEIELSRESDVPGVSAWSATLRSTALEARSHARSIARLFGPDQTPQFAVIACPIDSAGRDPIGALAVLVRCSSTATAERLQLHLRTACLQMATLLTRRTANRSGVEMSDIARVYTRAGQFRSLTEFAYTITNSARQRFSCDQAAMGVVRDGKIRVLCISGLDDVKRRSPGVHLIEQAMGECADAGSPIVAQQRDRWEESGLADEGLLHGRWRASAAGSCVLSVPVDAGDGPVAVVSFRRAADQPFDIDDIDAAQKLLAPLAGAIPLVGRATRKLPAHAVQSGRSGASWFMSRGSMRRKALILLALAGATWGVFGVRQYRVSVPAVVIAEREHIVASPMDGLVADVLVRSGEHVSEGQTLVLMDTRSLELERRDLEAQLHSAELRVAEGIAAREPAKASVAQSELKGLKTRLERVRTKLDESTISAPKDGIVIAHELEELTGRMVAAGDPLISIAEAGSLRLELRVPQARVADLTSGDRVRFASHARPESPEFTNLERIAPATVQREGSAVFLADAGLSGEQAWLLPGMEGVAMVEAGEKPNWWIAVHGLVDAARLRFWLD